MKVRQLMSRNVVTVGPSDSCLEAVARMHRARVSEDEMYMAPSAFVLLYWGVETVRESL
jgi:hypothetical protein